MRVKSLIKEKGNKGHKKANKVKGILEEKNSITGQYLSGAVKIDVPKKRRKKTKKVIKVVGATENNLKNINVDIPIGLLTCITGVSGSGKSSLINQILYKSLARELNRAKTKAGEHKERGKTKVNKERGG